MEKFKISGGKPLSGEIQVSGAKNAALPILAASLLVNGKTEITNVPVIEDVKRMLEIMSSIGAKVEWRGKNKLIIEAKNLDPAKMNYDAVCQFRASVMLLGSLINRFERVKIPLPGGCQIGARPLDSHILALERLGIEINRDGDFLYLERKGKPEEEIVMTEFSPTATTNLILATCLGKSKVKILCADYGYSVQELCWFLNQSGAKISGVGSHQLIIEGVEKLKETSYTIMPDPIETGTFIALAAATRSDVAIKNAVFDFLRLELEKFRLANVNFSIQEIEQRENYQLVDILVKPSSRLKAVKKIHDMPYPGFMTDLLPPFAVLMTQAEGTSLIQEWMYEDRLKYINELIKMGANVTICDPHRIIIIGPTLLTGQEMTMLDLRAGATLVIAALVAEGKSTISNIYQIDRGYEKIDERLKAIGADIKRI